MKLRRSGNTFSGSASMDARLVRDRRRHRRDGGHGLRGLCVTLAQQLVAGLVADRFRHADAARGRRRRRSHFRHRQLAGQDIGAVGQGRQRDLFQRDLHGRGVGRRHLGRGGCVLLRLPDAQRDGQITARVASLDNTDVWAKSGVMIRQTSRRTRPCDDRREAVQRDVAAVPDGPPASRRPCRSGPRRPPYWVRLSRSGNTFSGAVSSTGRAGLRPAPCPWRDGTGLCGDVRDVAQQRSQGVLGDRQRHLGAPSTPPPPPGGSVAISTPISRIVYQRNNSNQAFVRCGFLLGQCDAGRSPGPGPQRGAGQQHRLGCDRPRASAARIAGRDGLRRAGTASRCAPSRGSTQVATASVDRVGVGEVFVCVGHSVASGGNIKHPGLDGRARHHDSGQTGPRAAQPVQRHGEPAYMPRSCSRSIRTAWAPAPFGGGNYFWAKFRSMWRRTRTFRWCSICGFGGTSLEHWSKSGSVCRSTTPS